MTNDLATFIEWKQDRGYTHRHCAAVMNAPLTTVQNWVWRGIDPPEPVFRLMSYIDLYGEWQPTPRKKPGPKPIVRAAKPRPKKFKKSVAAKHITDEARTYQPITYHDLRNWEGRLHWTHPKAANAIGVPVHTYHNWHHNRRRIPSYIRRLCQYIEKYGEIT